MALTARPHGSDPAAGARVGRGRRSACRSRKWCLVALLFVASAPFARAADPEPARLATFPNGLRLLVLPRPDAPLVDVDTYVALRGAARKPGLAHLAEHLLFTTSAGAPAGSVVDTLALDGGPFNAFTSLNLVHLTSQCVPARLPSALTLEADRLARLAPRPEDLAYERRRVLGEYDLIRGLDPYADLDLRVTAMAFGSGGASGDPVLGSRDDIAAITAADVDSFLSESLRPERTVVLVSGPVDVDRVIALAASGVGALPPARTALAVRALPPPPPPGPCWLAHGEEQNDILAAGFRLPCASTLDAAMAGLAAAIMERESGHPQLQFYGDEALLTLNVEYTHGDSGSDSTRAAAAAAVFWEQTGRVFRNLGDTWQFEKKRKANVDALRALAADPLRRSHWRAQQLAAGSDLPEPDALAAVVDTLGQARVAAYFTERFRPERAYLAFAIGSPAKDATEDLAASWSRTLRLVTNPYLEFCQRRPPLPAARTLPVLAAVRDLPVGRTTTVTLANGIPVRVLSLPDQDEVFVGGVRRYPSPFAGAAGPTAGRLLLYGALVNLGYGVRGANIAPIGFECGRHTRVTPQLHSMTITADGPGDRARDVAVALHKRLTVDDFNPLALDAMKESVETWAAAVRDQAPLAAAAWSRAFLFGDDHALAAMLRPESADIRRCSQAKLAALHDVLCDSDDLTLVAVGGLEPADVGFSLAGSLGRLRRPARGDTPVMPAPRRDVGLRVFHETASDFARVSVLCGSRGPSAVASLGALDLEVIGRLVERRLHVAAARAGLDTLAVTVSLLPEGAQVLPTVSVVVPDHQASRALALIRGQIDTLAVRPIDADEEAYARLVLVGPLLQTLADPREARDCLLEWGRGGTVPEAPLADLCSPRPALLAERIPQLFTADSAAWTVIADTTRAGAREVAAALR